MRTLITLIFIIICIGIVISVLYWTIRNGISPMPSSSKAKKTILNAIPDDISDSIYELGSGWGTLAFSIAKKFPNQHIEAYETSLIPYVFCVIRLWMDPRPNLHFKRKDFFKISLINSAVIICYLYPEAMLQLKVKFEKELGSNCLIVSNTFSIPGWKPLEILEIGDLYHSKVYVYQIKSI